MYPSPITIYYLLWLHNTFCQQNEEKSLGLFCWARGSHCCAFFSFVLHLFWSRGRRGQRGKGSATVVLICQKQKCYYPRQNNALELVFKWLWSTLIEKTNPQFQNEWYWNMTECPIQSCPCQYLLSSPALPPSSLSPSLSHSLSPSLSNFSAVVTNALLCETLSHGFLPLVVLRCLATGCLNSFPIPLTWPCSKIQFSPAFNSIYSKFRHHL